MRDFFTAITAIKIKRIHTYGTQSMVKYDFRKNTMGKPG